jgi:hypothetical protein
MMINRFESQDICNRSSMGRLGIINPTDRRYQSPSRNDLQRCTSKLDPKYETKKPNYIFGMNPSNEYEIGSKPKPGGQDDQTLATRSLSEASSNDLTYSSRGSRSTSSRENSSAPRSRRGPSPQLRPKPLENRKKSLPPKSETSGKSRSLDDGTRNISPKPPDNRRGLPPRNETSGNSQLDLGEGTRNSLSRPPDTNRKSLPRRNQSSDNLRDYLEDMPNTSSQSLEANRKSLPPRNQSSDNLQEYGEDMSNRLSKPPDASRKSLSPRNESSSSIREYEDDKPDTLPRPPDASRKSMPPRKESLSNLDKDMSTWMDKPTIRQNSYPPRMESSGNNRATQVLDVYNHNHSNNHGLRIRRSFRTEETLSHDSHGGIQSSDERPPPIPPLQTCTHDEMDWRELITPCRSNDNRDAFHVSDSNLFASNVRKQSISKDKLHSSMSQIGQSRITQEEELEEEEEGEKQKKKKVMMTMTKSTRVRNRTSSSKTTTNNSSNNNNNNQPDRTCEDPLFLFKLSKALQEFTGPEKITSRYLAKLSETLHMPVAYSCDKGLELVTSEGLVLVSDLLQLES